MTDHQTYDSLLALAQGSADWAAAEEAFGHLAYCTECSDRLRAVREVRSDFQAAWGEFVAWDAGADLVSGVARFGRLRAWLDPARRLARVILEELNADGLFAEPLLIPGGAGADEPSVSSPVAEFRLASAELGIATVIVDADRQVISALLEPTSGVSVAALLKQRSPRLVLRAPDGSERREAPFTLVEAAPYLLAELGNLGRIEWLIAIEER